MNRFEVYRDVDRQWRWRFKGANGEVWFMSSEGYTRKRDAIRSINDLRSAIVQGDFAVETIR